MKNLILLSIMLLSLNCFSQTTKAQRYAIYTAKCNVIDTMKMQESGYLKIDTLVLTTYPTKSTYYGKTILNKVKVSSTRSLVVVVDTIWSGIKVPAYTYSPPPTTPPTVVPPTYDKRYYRWVYRNKTFLIKRCKPVTYTVWTVNEAYYENLMSTIESNIKILKTAK